MWAVVITVAAVMYVFVMTLCKVASDADNGREDDNNER